MQEKDYWASLSIDGIKKAMTEVPAKVKDSEQYGKQLSVNVKFWDDGSASLSVWNAATSERINIGKLMISKLEKQAPAPQAAPQASSSPFDSPF